MIRKVEGKTPGFVLDTKNTTYAFYARESGQLEHVYYGPKATIDDPFELREPKAGEPGNIVCYSKDTPGLALEGLCMEMSGIGKGDIREPFIELITPNGSTTTDFIYESDEIGHGKAEFATLPGSYDETETVDHLCIRLKDRNHDYHLELHYWVYEKEDVITRSARFINDSSEDVTLMRMMSLQLDLNEKGVNVSSFSGHWIKEMQKNDTKVNAGRFVISSNAGVSSNRMNNFFMVYRDGCTEDAGDCFGFHLIYSGNHYESIEVSSFDQTRITTGINPRGFAFHIAPGEDFEAPEAVMTFSARGFGAMSRHVHRFIRSHIVRGEWRDKERPVLLNSWEANYFNIDEGKLVSLAKKGKEVGVELFVMDDGWFGARDDDHKALGDWTPNTKKLPNGLKGLCDKITALGLKFGLWVEPEMVNTDSDLYRRHPNWAIEIPGQDHSEGRNQRFLDFCNPAVVDHMIEAMSAVFSAADISYVKWDMNRIFSDYYSQYLPPERQQEVSHRYQIGMYRLMKTIMERFPKILFEGCASGGCRFDLGILCYFPQIWGSDNSDAISRLSIQNGYSYGYPMSTVAAHVSAVPNHQTLRVTPISSRFNVAAFGVLGYECNLSEMKKEDLEAITEQIKIYKKHRKTLQQGDFYRISEGNVYEWLTVSKDKKEAVGMMLQKEVKPNEGRTHFAIKGLHPDAKYHFYSLPFNHNVKIFGSLINAVAPVHVKQDGLVHNVIAKAYPITGEVEDITAYGDALMGGGVFLKQAFTSSGFNEETRVMTDFGSRMYFIEEQSGATADEQP